VVKDNNGNVTELKCTYDPETKGGNAPDGRKVKGTIHWVSAEHAIDGEVRLYDRLFRVPNPASKDNFIDALNPDSLTVLNDCKMEPELGKAVIGKTVQFERLGYFCKDPDSGENTIFNRTVPLRDSWAKIEKQMLSGQKN
jgi:glutaminyl-tRNA synthetase